MVSGADVTEETKIPQKILFQIAPIEPQMDI